MVTVEQIDPGNKKDVKRFIGFQYELYKDCPQWVPPIVIDKKTQLNKNKHPYYEHSDADFFIAVKDGKDVGVIAALVNNLSNEYHNRKQAQFYLFECINDQEVAIALFDRVVEWSHERNLDTVVGPKGFGVLDGYGILIKGYEHRQMMTMLNYNYPYYRDLVENYGFGKEVDFVSHYVNAEQFNFPARIHSIADRVLNRGRFRMQEFYSKNDLKEWAQRIGDTYNKSFVNNWEYYPLTQKEIEFILNDIITIANPRLIKLILYDEEPVGFLFGFPDVSGALQKCKGRLFPFGLFQLMSELKKTDWIAFNGAGILPEYHGRGGNALLYSQMEKTAKSLGFKHCDLPQIAETAVDMRSDLANIGSEEYTNHRVYVKSI
ncbi:MAG: hypothetical protein JXA19_03040 [Anaerolineales bacterium]|nr:hypothetical protein [Anaerolineales bacterium]